MRDQRPHVWGCDCEYINDENLNDERCLDLRKRIEADRAQVRAEERKRLKGAVVAWSKGAGSPILEHFIDATFPELANAATQPQYTQEGK